MARRATLILLSVLGSVLLAITILLSSISLFLRIDDPAYLTEDDVPWPDPPLSNISSVPLPNEHVPRILHQTWKDDVLPEKWRGVSQGCRDMMPDYEYVLWTDASSRAFIAEHYAWFLPTFDGYTYPIMRADAIRYFILYHYGGIYLDLDVGCLRRLDPLLSFSAILPKTKPVGVSNDLMFAAPNHPFMRQATESLKAFDRNWIMNYPTVMFSTGPMFLSAIYGLYTSAAGYPRSPTDEVRVLPKSLYGKNAVPGEAPHAFFSHYYGSSWHADDAGLVIFLGSYGTLIMYFALCVLLSGAARLAYLKLRPRHSGTRRMGRYEVVLPRVYTDPTTGRHRIDLGGFTMSPTSSSAYTSAPPSPPFSPSAGQHVLPLTVEDSPLPSPAPPHVLGWASALLSSLSTHATSTSPAPKPHSRRRRSVLFFLPAFFHPHSHSQPTAYRAARRRSSPQHAYDAIPEEDEGMEDVVFDDGREDMEAPPPEYEGAGMEEGKVR